MTDAPQWQFDGSNRAKSYRKASQAPLFVSILAVMGVVGIGVAYVNRDYLMKQISSFQRPEQQPNPVVINDSSHPKAQVAVPHVQPKVLGESAKGTLNPPEPRLMPDSTIIPGFGIKNLHIGMAEQVVEEFALTFKDGIYKEKADDHTEVWNFNLRGIDCSTQGGTITRLTFNFRQRSFVSYDGVTDKGIGMWSTVGDVLRAYGPPELEQTSGVAVAPQKLDPSGRRILKSFSAGSSPMLPLPRYRISYPKRGVMFGFLSGELEYVHISPPAQ